MAKLWFRAKRYGWGWTPATIEGWGVMAGFVIAIAGNVAVLAYRVRHGTTPRPAMVEFYLVTAFLVVILLAICWKTGEPPRWRWGK